VDIGGHPMKQCDCDTPPDPERRAFLARTAAVLSAAPVKAALDPVGMMNPGTVLPRAPAS